MLRTLGHVDLYIESIHGDSHDEFGTQARLSGHIRFLDTHTGRDTHMRLVITFLSSFAVVISLGSAPAADPNGSSVTTRSTDGTNRIELAETKRQVNGRHLKNVFRGNCLPSCPLSSES